MTVHIPDDEQTGAPAKSPLPIHTDRSGRSVISAPMIGCLVRVSDENDSREKIFGEATPVLVIEVDSPDPALRGLWVREKDLGAAAAA